MLSINSLRLTAFTQTPPAAAWMAFAGGDPDSRTEVRPEAKVIEVGQVDGQFLSASTGPGRVDWTVAHSAAPDALTDIGTLEEALVTFTAGAARALDATDNVLRVAVGVVAIKRVKSREEGYRELQQLLASVEVRPEVTSDLLYQVNYPIDVGELGRLNRLMKFSVARQQLLQVGPSVAGVVVGPVDHAVRVELDFSTAPATSPMVNPINGFQKLVDMARSAVLRGEASCL